MRLKYIGQDLPSIEVTLRDCAREAANITVEDLQEVEHDKLAP